MVSSIRKPVVPLCALVAITLLIGCAGLVSVQPTEPVRAGDTATLNVVVNQAPNFEGAELQITLAGPGSPAAILTGKVKMKPGVTIYAVPINIPATAPGGTWNLSSVTFFTGFQQMPLPFNQYSLQVLANPNLKFPTSATVFMTPVPTS